MNFPKWAPSQLLASITYYETEASKGGVIAAQCNVLAGMWRRLLTRPEMEGVWTWVFEITPHYIDLTDQLGFFRQFGTIVEDFHSAPRLSESGYAKEMAEIADLAATLADRVRRFSTSGLSRDPFESILWPPSTEFEIRDQLNKPADWKMYWGIRSNFPPALEYLKRIEAVATDEGNHLSFRLPVSRKSNDFRAYLIREISNYFLMFENGYSPSKVATICSVALDDPDITPDLVRKLARPVINEHDSKC